MPLLLLAAASSFACLSPSHHDGDAIRCAGMGKSMRLHAIDAPEMPGACREGRACTPGDPYAARDYLAGLTAGRSVQCEQVDTDRYGRRVVACTADGQDLGCAMVAGGHAVERYGSLDCGGTALAQATTETAADYTPQPPAVVEPPATREQAPRYYAPATAKPAGTVAPIIIALWLLVINIAAYTAFAIDKRRAITDPRRRIPEASLLTLAALGGTPGAITAQQRLRHKTRKQPFANLLLAIAGLQLGAIAGLIILA